ncbi:MAG: hypothetical protein KO253_07510 [Methanobrevibacter arboriphilus]|nr:hypothetical protein [Methanobrevibacter arboriphilus]
MLQGLLNGKIYFKGKEIVVERVTFQEKDKMRIFLANDNDYEFLISNNKFDIYFDNTALLNCNIDKDNSSKEECVGVYGIKRNVT